MMEQNFIKKHHNVFFNTLLILFIVVLLALNFLFAYLTLANASYIDLTPEGLYTLTDAMKSTCKQLKGDITITFCADPDQLLSYNDTRYVYIMCKELSLVCPNISVETYNIVQNPTAVNQYKVTSASVIKATDMIVACGNRYRISSCSSFWTLSEDATDTSVYYSFNGEYKLATILLSVTSVINPVVCVTYGHGEKIYVDENDQVSQTIKDLSNDSYSSFYRLLKDEGLTIKFIDLDHEEIPSDCILLVMNGPTTDYEDGDPNSMSENSPIRKIHQFLAKDFRSMILFKDPTETLENVEALAFDWGVAYEDGIYIREDAQHALTDSLGTNQKIIATLDDNEYSTANAVYQAIAALATAPRTIVENTGAVHKSWINSSIPSSTTQNINAYYFDFLLTSENAKAYTTEGLLDTDESQSYSLAALSYRRLQDTYEDVRYYSYFFGAATTELTTNTYLDNMAYGNYDVLYALIRYISRTDEYASLELGGTSLNSPTPGGKVLLTETISSGTSGNEKYDEDGVVVGYYNLLTDDKKVSCVIWVSVVPLIVAAIVGTWIVLKRKIR